MSAFAILMRNVDRKSTLAVRLPWVSACFNKDLDRFEISVARCPMQWCVADRRLHSVAVGLNTEQIAHDFDVSPCCGTKQCGLTDGVSPVHVGTALNQTDDLLEIATPRGSVQSRFRGPAGRPSALRHALRLASAASKTRGGSCVMSVAANRSELAASS